MPTLLNVNNYHYRRGGADVLYLEHARMFREKGWEVADFSMHHPQNLESEWSDFFIDEIEFGDEYSIVDKVTRAGRVVYSRQSRSRLARVIEKSRPDIAHLHNIYHHISPSILPLLRKQGIPVVLTNHDLKIACPNYQMLTHDGICERCKGGRIHNVVRHRCIKGSTALSGLVFLESAMHKSLRTYTRNVDRFVTSSSFYLEKFVEWGFNREQFVHIPNHVDVSDFRPDFEPGSAFVYFGRLAPEKGVATVVRAAAAAGVPVWLIGTGPEEPALRALAAELGADVEFLGFLTGEPLRDRVRRARAVVLASEWYENGPVSVLEAYALGKPVIGARIGGITEMMRDGETGFGFTSGSVPELTEVFVRTAALPDGTLEQIGREARRWIEVDFSVERFIERTSGLYAELGVGTI
jgi:glycosyltransferase involved in cell wall biosynthesis